MEDRSALAQFFIQSGLVSRPAAAEMAMAFAPLQLERDAYLLREGQVSDSYLYLQEGWLRSYALSPDGSEVTTAIFSDGQPVFEPASFFLRQPARENVQALTACTAWSLTFAGLNELFHTRQEFREFGRSILVRTLVGLKQRTLGMITETAEERYAALLRDRPAVFQHVPLKYIASYLGVTDTSLSRIRREMARKA